MAGITEEESVTLQAEDSFALNGRSEETAPEETPACQSCRKKKSKCSRSQPCLQCVKSGVECLYEDKRLKGGIKTGVIERLNQRIDTIENMFLGQGILLQQLFDAKHADSETSKPPLQSESLPSYADRLRTAFCSIPSQVAPGTVDDPGAPDSSISNKRRRTSHNTFVPARHTAAATEDSCLDIFERVSSIAGVDAMVDYYFKFIHPWIPVLHPATFLRRVKDAGSHIGASIVFQAIVAVTLNSMPSTQDSETEDHRATCAAECRQLVITSAMESNTKESIQALLLVTFDSIKRGLSVSPWSVVAIICRKIEDLQLNSEVSAPKRPISDFFTTSSVALPGATAWVEVEERRRVFWAGFLMDRFCSITTGSNMNIASKGIQRRLPCDGYMWELDQRVETSFFKPDKQQQQQDEAESQATEAPFPAAYVNAERPSGIGGFAYTIEATESLHLVTKFHARHKCESNNSAQISSWLSKFRQLDSRLLQWELCLAHCWRDVRVVNGYIDPNLTLAHMTHNSAIIILHQELAYCAPSSRAWLSSLVSAASREASVMAAMKIAKIAARYLGASDGIPPHQFVFCLYTAGQLFLRHVAHQSVPLMEEFESILTALNMVSQRLDIGQVAQENISSERNYPSAKFSRSLVKQRDQLRNPSTAPTPATPAPQEHGSSSFADLQIMPWLGEMPTMSQHWIASPSSGSGWVGATSMGDDATAALRDLMALKDPLLQNVRLTSTMTRTQSQNQAANAQSPDEFDFIAELRKLESRAREHDRRLLEESRHV